MMIDAIQIALSGLMAASRKVAAVASNVANLQTVGSLDNPQETPYTPLETQQTAQSDSNGNPLGVQSTFVLKATPFVPAYDPGSPFANADGLVGMPNIDLAEEAVNMMTAKIAYKAGLNVIKTADEMQKDLLNAVNRKV